MFKGNKPSLAYFKVFEIKYFVHINDKKDVDKFEAKSEPEIFLGYSETSRVYKIYNLKHDTVDESSHVIFNESVDKSVLQGMKIIKILWRTRHNMRRMRMTQRNQQDLRGR